MHAFWCPRLEVKLDFCHIRVLYIGKRKNKRTCTRHYFLCHNRSRTYYIPSRLSTGLIWYFKKKWLRPPFTGRFDKITCHTCHLIMNNIIPLFLYRVFFALSFSAHSVGHTMAFLQDYAKAKHSASLIFQLIEKPTEIDSQSTDGYTPVRLFMYFKHRKPIYFDSLS